MAESAVIFWATVSPSVTIAPEASNLPLITTSPVPRDEPPAVMSAIAPAGNMETINAAISAYVEYLTLEEVAK